MTLMPDAAASQTTRYALDQRGSRFTVYAYAGGLLSAVGHDPVIAARDFRGEIQFAPEIPSATTLALTVAATSLRVQNDVSDRDRREIERTMSDEVLETERYPEIVYEASAKRIEAVSDGRYRIEVDGDLSLHGVRRRQGSSVQVFVFGDTLRAQGEVLLLQTDYGIKLVSVAGGALKIKDELKCAFDLLARKAT
jgi:polyisoprenoid-binding protein YceI